MHIINAILVDYFCPEGTDTAPHTANKISAHFNTLLSSSSSTFFSVESFLWSSHDSLWNSLLRNAIGHEPRAVELLLALTEQKITSEATIWGVKFDWADLPLFESHIRESFNGPLQNVNPSEDLQKLDAEEIYIRFASSFTAYRSLTVLLSHLSVNPCFGWTHSYFIWQLRSSPLESPLGPNETLAEWIFDLELALIWLEVAGEPMRRLGEVGQADRSLRQGVLWEGGQGGWSEARWKFWATRAGEIERESAHEAIRRLGRQVKEIFSRLNVVS
ncbi:Protein of unknown function DUF3632 [Phaffia rhodozyma]|uniref:Uncharacterized protein n=1 Tax=Phaffia rhodozyma TaxID=264483 RepID=A0A0F7SHS7_PHARH|nr:Protein of unknown function DUF3632 [Phaffia rhodozyma]